MEARELRIGNYVMWDDESNEVAVIAGIYKNKDYGDEVWVDFFENECIVPALFDEFNPIVLTEEWLNKLGIKRIGVNYDDEDIYCKDESFWIIRIGDMFKLHEFDFDILYVHQLQNIYFALTGEELTLK